MRTIRLVLPALALAACGDDGASSPVDGGTDGPPGSTREVIGTIDVREQRYLQFEEDQPVQEHLTSDVRGWFYDGQPPRWHRETMAAGDCVLKQYTPALCEPACTNGLCVEPNVCEPWPSLVGVGRLTVSGLTTSVRMTGDGWYYPESALPPDLFGDTATVSAAIEGGGGIPALTLATTGVPPITGAILDGKLVLEPGQDAYVRWTPAGGDARVRLTLNSNNQGHGMPYLGIIECDSADAAGEVRVSASLIDEFPETRAWTICAGTDCPPSTLRRYHRATVPVGDRDVELIVASELAFGVDHILDE